MAKKQGPSKETLALKSTPIYCMMCGQLLEHPHLCSAGTAPELERLRAQNAALLTALEDTFTTIGESLLDLEEEAIDTETFIDRVAGQQDVIRLAIADAKGETK